MATAKILQRVRERALTQSEEEHSFKEGQPLGEPKDSPKHDLPFSQQDRLEKVLRESILPLENIRPPEGIASGWAELDQLLLWKGFPKGDLVLLMGAPGTGSTSLWLRLAAQVQARGQWAAWMDEECRMLPTAARAVGVDLEKLLVVQNSMDDRRWFWILQEMLTSTLFEVIGCRLGGRRLTHSQLQKLQRMARTYKVTLVFLAEAKHKWSQLYPLVLECRADDFIVHKASHRATPLRLVHRLPLPHTLGSLDDSGGINANSMFSISKRTGGLLC